MSGNSKNITSVIAIDYASLTKRYYSIGEVAELMNVKTSVLRFWEESFKQLNPRKSGGGNRLYTVKDIEIIEKIYHLVKDQKYTLDGAEKALDQSEVSLDSDKVKHIEQKLKRVQKKLKGLIKRIDYMGG